MQVADRCVVRIHYRLTNDSGEVLDSSEGKDPLTYLHGARNIIPGLEKALAGKQAGDKMDVKISAAEGYGERDARLVQQVPKNAFQGVDEVKVGMRFNAEGPQGNQTVMITAVADEHVTVDGNHPLAGQDLNFAVEVTEVRQASAEEIEHGHPHGPGGQQH
ncbi:MAG: peptidylprolyl isomerase [Panacagrimonas sp.]